MGERQELTPLTKRGREMKRLLVINPNSSVKMTGDIRSTLGKLIIQNAVVDVVHMQNSPQVLESFKDYTVAGAEVIKYIMEADLVRKGYDGLLLACFGDPSLYAIKEISDVPVIGIAEASISLALLLGYKYGIIAASSKAKPMMESMIMGYGLENRLACVESLEVNIEAFINDREFLEEKFIGCARKAMNKGADVLVLGCAGMTIIGDNVEEKLGIPVIDPIKAGIAALNSIVDSGLKISRAGLYSQEV